jgi:D-alanine-D-alanine ligase
VAVIAGGRSAEREVSLWSGREVLAALEARGHDAEMVDFDREVWDRLRDGGFDCAFIALHGRLGEDGSVQGLLEVMGLPYTGSGVLASALCMDKTVANQVMRWAGLLVPDWEEITGSDSDQAEALTVRLGLPLVVKPVREGSTVGLTIAGNVDEVATGIVEAGRYDPRVLVQRFIAGTEITVGVLSTPDITVLPTLEITYENPTYDYDAKYTAGKSHHIIPARISPAAQDAAAGAARRAFELLGCDGMARVDMIVEDEKPWILEVNTIPGLTALSLLPDAARAGGFSFEDFCDGQVRHAISLGSRKL